MGELVVSASKEAWYRFAHACAKYVVDRTKNRNVLWFGTEAHRQHVVHDAVIDQYTEELNIFVGSVADGVHERITDRYKSLATWFLPEHAEPGYILGEIAAGFTHLNLNSILRGHQLPPLPDPDPVDPPRRPDPDRDPRRDEITIDPWITRETVIKFLLVCVGIGIIFWTFGKAGFAKMGGGDGARKW